MLDSSAARLGIQPAPCSQTALPLRLVALAGVSDGAFLEDEIELFERKAARLGDAEVYEGYGEDGADGEDEVHEPRDGGDGGGTGHD